MLYVFHGILLGKSMRMLKFLENQAKRNKSTITYVQLFFPRKKEKAKLEHMLSKQSV